MLSLLIGDLFIPDRAVDIPLKFRKLLSPNAPAVPSNSKISQVLCLGNITQSASTLRFLHDLSPFFCAVRGEFDDANLTSQQLALLDAKNSATLPLYRVVTAGNFRIGFTSGHQIVPRNDPLLLLAFAREIDVDILVWGGTHRVEAFTLDGKFFISPGSATGAHSMSWPDLDEDEDEDEENFGDAGESIGDGDSFSGTAHLQEREDGGNCDNKESNDEASEKENVKEDEPNEDGEDELEFDPLHLSSSLPSFCLLDTNSSMCTLYIYTYTNDEVKVDKVLYLKD